MPARRNGIRTSGSVPADYAGPVYHGAAAVYGAANNQTRLRMRVDDATEELLFHGDRNLKKRILTSGTILDAEGQLLPPWRTPLTAEIIGNGQPDRIEFDFYYGAAWIVSERVHDAIVALEPDRHVFIAIDAAGADRTYRYYAMYIPHGILWGERPLLHPAKNGLVKGQYTNGKPRWERPGRDRDAPAPFDYLDGRVVDGLHLFTGELVGCVFSPALFEKLAGFGDIFRDATVLVPMGVCSDDDADYVAPPLVLEGVKAKGSLLGRLFGR